MTFSTPDQVQLSSDQKTVLQEIFAPAWEGSEWPQFALIDGPLNRRGIDAQSALMALTPKYVRRSGSSPLVQPDETLRLTLHGANELEASGTVIPIFLQVLAYLVAAEWTHVATREHLQVTVTEADVAQVLLPGRSEGVAKALATRIGLFIKEESSDWGSYYRQEPDGPWGIILSNQIRRYKGVYDIAKYFAKSPQYAVQAPVTITSFESDAVAESNVIGDENIDPRDVFIVHGRDDQAHIAVSDFLVSLGLRPVPFLEIASATGSAAPYVGQVVSLAFKLTHAVIVLFTPDDTVQLHPDFHEERDPDWERVPTGQARPNVLFEAGMALAIRPDRTVLVEIGMTRPFTDIAGRLAVRLTGSVGSLNSLAQRLADAGCPVNRSGDAWLDVSRFQNLLAIQRVPVNSPPPAAPQEVLRSGTLLPSTPSAAEPRLAARLLSRGKNYLLELSNRGGVSLHDVSFEFTEEARNWHVVTDVLGQYPIPLIEPRAHVRFPMAITMGGVVATTISLKAKTPNGEDYETHVNLSIFD